MTETKMWHKLPDESPDWYFKFSRYFLPLGPSRTLMKAWKSYAAIELGRDDVSAMVDKEWQAKSAEYNWYERSDAYDMEVFTESGAVEVAKSLLKLSAVDAVNALNAALTNSRLSVQAAKEILDRSGVISVQGHVNADVPFSADDMNEAEREVREWEQKAKSG